MIDESYAMETSIVLPKAGKKAHQFGRIFEIRIRKAASGLRESLFSYETIVVQNCLAYR